MSRRALLAALLTSPLVAQAAPRSDCLVIGDSWAHYLAPRVGRLLKARHLRTAADARGGESAHDYLRRGWWRHAIEREQPRDVIASLGINAVQSERPKLAETIGALDTLAHAPVLWVAPHPDGFKQSLGYLHAALREAGVRVFWCPALPLDSGKIHLTARGYDTLASLLVEQIWPTEAT